MKGQTEKRRGSLKDADKPAYGSDTYRDEGVAIGIPTGEKKEKKNRHTHRHIVTRTDREEVRSSSTDKPTCRDNYMKKGRSYRNTEKPIYRSSYIRNTDKSTCIDIIYTAEEERSNRNTYKSIYRNNSMQNTQTNRHAETVINRDGEGRSDRRTTRHTGTIMYKT